MSVVEDSKSQSQKHYEAVAAICRCGDCHCCERAANRLTTGKN